MDWSDYDAAVEFLKQNLKQLRKDDELESVLMKLKPYHPPEIIDDIFAAADGKKNKLAVAPEVTRFVEFGDNLFMTFEEDEPSA